MRKYLPYEKFTLFTSLTEDIVKARVQQNIGTSTVFNKYMPGSSEGKPYYGHIKGNNFTMQRVIGYKNSFLPVVKGRIYLWHDGKTRIDVRMRPHMFLIIFMCFWLGIVSFLCLAIIMHIALHAGELSAKSAPLLIPFGMFMLGWCLLYFSFKRESKIARADLKSALTAEEL